MKSPFFRLVKMGVINKDVISRDIKKLVKDVEKYKADKDYNKIKKFIKNVKR